MGREIRRVPADWQHPLHERCPHGRKCEPMCYRPLYDDDYQSAAEKWMAGYANFKPDEYSKYYWEYDNTPDEERYHAQRWTPDEATHYQVYETVSEGTPVTPHFATREELIDHLVRVGDDWDHGKGWSRESAESFVRGRGWRPSLIIERSVAGVSIQSPRDMTL